MIQVKNNTARPVHINLGLDEAKKIPCMKHITLMPGNNLLTKDQAEAIISVHMVESMVDDGEIVIRTERATDGPSAAQIAKKRLAESKATKEADTNVDVTNTSIAEEAKAKAEATKLTPAQKAAATKAKKKAEAEAEAKAKANVPAAPKGE